MADIEVSKLTKDYGHGRGIYDVTIEVKKGETLGFLGPNGAGKSTTMRHLMGFSNPQSGSAKILDMDCRNQYEEILNYVGYLPGEVAIPEGLSGWEFIRMMQGLKKSKNKEKVEYLLEKFRLDPNANVKRMSIGEKRKLAIVTAFMDDPDILLLDEPTSGLDPVMQEVFIEFIREEKEKGKTILLSSHIFSEVEAVCDRIAIIKDGRVVSIVDAAEVKHGLRKTLELAFVNEVDYRNFLKEGFEVSRQSDEDKMVAIVIEDKDTNTFLKKIVNYELSEYNEKSVSLEDYFMHFYKNNKTFGGVKNGRNH